MKLSEKGGAVMEQKTNQPAETGLPASAVPDAHPEHEVGNGLTKKEAMRIRMQHMNRAEIAAMFVKLDGVI